MLVEDELRFYISTSIARATPFADSNTHPDGDEQRVMLMVMMNAARGPWVGEFGRSVEGLAWSLRVLSFEDELPRHNPRTVQNPCHGGLRVDGEGEEPTARGERVL